MTTFWQRVLNETESRGISRKELSSATGIPYNTIVGYSAKGIEPNLENAIKIAEYLDLSVEYLYKGTDSGLPQDIYLVAKRLTAVREDIRGSLIYMIDNQIDYWVKVQDDVTIHKLPD